LFDGAIRHHDSLGSDQLIEPGAINYMTAGHGIVHSERTPEPLRSKGGKMNGIQCWIAVPETVEDAAPAFSHHPSDSIPEISLGDVKARVLLGSVFGAKSPVPVQSDLFYAEIKMPPDSTLVIDEPAREAAFYIVEGEVDADLGQPLSSATMAVIRNGRRLEIKATTETHLMLLGGASLGPRFLFWNFVASSKEKLEQAKRDYANGPGTQRFPKVPGDTQEFIPLPDEPTRGTPL
jgi:redox-sensitive bicupin YhaK (pirin superfamily)